MTSFYAGQIVKIGKGDNTWTIIHITPKGDRSIIVPVTRKIGGGWERSPYMPGRQMRRVIETARLTAI